MWSVSRFANLQDRQLPAPCDLAYILTEFEPDRPAENSDWRLRLEFSGMARRVLSDRSARIRMARILRALSARGGDRFDVLRGAGRECGAPLGRNDAGFVPLQLQASTRNHSRLSAARLYRGTELFSARGRTARIEATGCPDSVASIVHAKGRPASAPQVSSATSQGFSVRH
jgi:hypothetical protein